MIGALVEGNSIRSIERMTGVHRDTICRLLVRVGEGCESLMNDTMRDLACQRIQVDEIRVQISSDALSAYVEAVERAFGNNVDYGQIVKSYEADPIGPGRYSPPRVVSVERTSITGAPEHSHISTSYVARQNLTMRMSIRRFTRLTNAFSKKVENMRAAVALHFAHYNFVRIHKTLRVTPAMEAGISNHLWSVPELLDAAASN